MSEHQSAAILAFPAKSRGQSDDRAQDRLALALAGLDQALATQRAAVVAWRAALADLHEATGGLRRSLSTYDAVLGSLSGECGALSTETRWLAATADSVARQTAR